MDRKIINVLHVAFILFIIIIVLFNYLGLKQNPFVLGTALVVSSVLLMNSISEQIDEKVRKRMTQKTNGGKNVKTI